ncbi:MAG: glycosyltransferase family 2 protein [Acidimicrobiales bacterium]
MHLAAQKTGTDPPRLAIIIVTYRSSEQLHLCLSSIAASTSHGIDLRIIVVDNSAYETTHKENTQAVLGSSWPFPVDYLPQGDNLGYAKGNNVGFAYAQSQGCDFLWVLNPDVRLCPGALGALANALRGGEGADDAGLWGTMDGRMGYPYTPDLGRLNILTTQTSELSRMPAKRNRNYLVFPSGHSLVLRAHVFAQLGGFCEEYFLFYEEADLVLRAASQKIPFSVLASVAVIHDQGGSTGSQAPLRFRSEETLFHACRSCALFYRKHFVFLLPIVCVSRLARAVKMTMQGKPRSGLAVIKGLIAGLTGS